MNKTLRRCALSAIVFASALLLCGSLRAADSSEAPRRDGKIRTLVVTGGHGFDKNALPKAFSGHDDIDYQVVPDQPKGKPALFEDVSGWAHDVVVLYNFNRKLSAARRANFLKLMDKGVGLVVLHHAIAAWPQWDEFEKITGCKYYLKPTERNGVKHPRSIWKEGVDIKVHVEDPNHPITKGLADFTVHDETYGKWTYHPGSRLLLTTDCPLNNKQLAWVKTYRKSRVFFFQLGHGPSIFSDKSYRRVVARAIRWTARRLDGTKDEQKQRSAKK